VAVQFRRHRAKPAFARRTTFGGVRAHLPPSAAAGLSMTVNGRGAAGLPTGTALAGITLALITALAAVGLTSSLDDLTATAARFGAPWDVSASAAVQQRGDATALRALVGRLPEVQGAAGLLGTDALLGEDIAWVQAYEPVPGVDAVIGPVITAGRAPATADEIVLGARTMVDQGLSIGDVITVEPTTSRAGDVTQMTIVGTAVINDNSENNPGRGAIVTVGWMDRFAQETSATTFVIRLAPGADLEAVSNELSAVATAGVTGPVRQGAIRNLERVRAVPLLLAIVVGLLAVASLAHALVLSVRRQRAQLAVFKTIGFRRSQVGLAVASHASSLVLLAAVVGIPLGIVAGRWGWQLVTDGLGLVSPSVTSAFWVLCIVLGTVMVANVVAAFPGWAAARAPTAEALRAE